MPDRGIILDELRRVLEDEPDAAYAVLFDSAACESPPAER